MDLRKLETFVRAAETSSLSGAAKQMHLSQPAASHQIKSIEGELGVELFTRANTGLKLTEAGRLFLPLARRLLNDSDQIKEIMSSLKKAETGELRIACSSTSGRYVLPLVVARFRMAYPSVPIRILTCQPKNMVARLLGNEAHLGIVSSEPLESGLQTQEFFRDPIGLIVPGGHRWAGASIEPSDLIQESMILREESSGTRRVMLEELAKFDISLDDLNIFLEVGNVEAALELVAGGYGVSFVSGLASRYLRRLERVVNARVNGVEMTRVNYLVRKGIASPHRARDAFWGFIHAPENADLLHPSLAL